MFLSFLKFENLNAAIFIGILTSLNFVNTSSNDISMDSAQDNYSNLKSKNKLSDNIDENSKIHQIDAGSNFKSSNSYFICICVDKSKFYDTLSPLLKALITKKDKKIFSRRLSYLSDIYNLKNYFYWEKIPVVLQYAFSNKIKTAKNYPKEDYLYQLMEFNPSNESLFFKMNSLTNFISTFYKKADNEFFDKEKGYIFNQNTIKQDFSDKSRDLKDFDFEKNHNPTMSFNTDNSNDLDPCFFCISDSIDLDFDYTAIGNVIKKKILHLEGYCFKPIDILNNFLKNFIKNEQTITILSSTIFNHDGFPKEDTILKRVMDMEAKYFVEHITLKIEEKIKKSYFDNEKNESIESYLNALVELETLETVVWNDFFEEYDNRFQKDTNRYIFLQLNEDNYRLIEDKFKSLDDSEKYDIKRNLIFKLIREKHYSHSLYFFEHLNHYFFTFKEKCRIDSKLKVVYMMNHFLKYAKIRKEIKESSKTLFLSQERYMNEKNEPLNFDIKIENNGYDNIEIFFSVDRKFKNSDEYLCVDFECTFMSNELYSSKISIKKRFLDQKIYNYFFDENYSFPFALTSIIDPNDYYPEIKLNLNIYGCFNISRSTSATSCEIYSDFYDPDLRCKNLLINLNEHIKKENLKQKIFIMNGDSFITQLSNFSENNLNIKIKPKEFFTMEKLEECKWENSNLKPIHYKYETGFKFFLYRDEKNIGKEVGIVTMKFKRDFFINEIFDKVLNIFIEASDFTECVESKKIKIEPNFIKFYSDVFNEKKYKMRCLIDKAGANKIWGILNEGSALEIKMKKCLDFLVDSLLYKIREWYLSYHFSNKSVVKPDEDENFRLFHEIFEFNLRKIVQERFHISLQWKKFHIYLDYKYKIVSNIDSDTSIRSLLDFILCEMKMKKRR